MALDKDSTVAAKENNWQSCWLVAHFSRGLPSDWAGYKSWELPPVLFVLVDTIWREKSLGISRWFLSLMSCSLKPRFIYALIKFQAFGSWLLFLFSGWKPCEETTRNYSLWWIIYLPYCPFYWWNGLWQHQVKSKMISMEIVTLTERKHHIFVKRCLWSDWKHTYRYDSRVRCKNDAGTPWHQCNSLVAWQLRQRNKYC